MNAAIVAILVWFGVILPQPTYFTISGYDPGGNVETYVSFYEKIAASGVGVRVDGACISACTLVLAVVPPERICVTNRALFGFHMASIDDKPDPEMTMVLSTSFYPQWVKDWIKTHSIKGDGELQEELIYMKITDSKQYLRECPAATDVPGTAHEGA